MNRSHCPLTSLLFAFALACFALSPIAQAVVPAPDGGYPNFNTAEGDDALDLNVGVGAGNTGVGWRSLFFTSTGNFNTGCGAGALLSNNGDSNTAIGAAALLLNAIGTENVAVGTDALVFNDASGLGTANFNTAVGAGALGGDPTIGNMSGSSNNAVGSNALGLNRSGSFNEAMGVDALAINTDGNDNVGIGDSAAAANTTGSFNTVIGYLAGPNLSAGMDNIYIGATAGDSNGDESGTIRIGDPDVIVACFIGGISGVAVTGNPVIVSSSGQLGVAAAGHPLSMNELLKERQVVQQLKVTTEKQAATIALQESQIQSLTAALKQQAELESTVAQQQKQIDALTAGLQKVSAQLEVSKPVSQTIANIQ